MAAISARRRVEANGRQGDHTGSTMEEGAEKRQEKRLRTRRFGLSTR